MKYEVPIIVTDINVRGVIMAGQKMAMTAIASGVVRMQGLCKVCVALSLRAGVMLPALWRDCAANQ